MPECLDLCQLPTVLFHNSDPLDKAGFHVHQYRLITYGEMRSAPFTNSRIQLVESQRYVADEYFADRILRTVAPIIV